MNLSCLLKFKGKCILACILSIISCASIVAARDDTPPDVPDDVYGYTDTPVLSWCGYRKHDPARPMPVFVDTGTADHALEPPSDAEVLFDGDCLTAWKPTRWKVSEGELIAGQGNLKTRHKYGDFQLFLEFMTPLDTEDVRLTNRGNSGVLLMGRYEIQIFDSHPQHEKQIYADGMCAAIYGETPPLVNASRPPGQWQTYNIIFNAPVFDGDEMLRPARVTVFHNGVLVHYDAVIHGPMSWRTIADYQPHADALPLELQGHRSPVRFRNIWIRPLEVE